MNAEQEQIYSKRSTQIVNILKGLAIWMVVTVHFFQSISMHPYIEMLANCMQLGCQIFFTLSCFTLCLSFNKQKLSYWQYFKKRVLKLFLAYYVMIIFGVAYRVVFAVKGGTSVIDAINIKGVIINALFLNGLVPNPIIHNQIVRGGWFIGTLFILYLLFPLLYKLFSIKNQKWQKCKVVVFPLLTIIVSAIIIGAIYVVFGFGSYPFFVYTSFINQICAFIFGFVIFYLYQTVKIKKVKLPLLKAIISAILAIVLFIKIPLAHYIIVIVLVALATTYTFCFLFNNAFTKEMLDSELIMRFLAKTGTISLGIYYTHSYLVWDVTLKIIEIIYKLDTNPHVLIKACVGIIIYTACYWIGKLFTYLIKLAQNPLLKALKVK